MMDSGDERAAAVIVLDQVELPQRVLAIQRPHRQFGDPRLQRHLFQALAATRQLFAHDVTGDVELRILGPGGAGGMLLDALAKPAVAQQPVLDPLAQVGIADCRA